MEHLNECSEPLIKGHYLQCQVLDLRTCKNCESHEGETSWQNYLTVKVLRTRKVVNLQALIWEKCTGQCITTSDLRECPICAKKKKISNGYHSLTFLQRCPIVLPMLLNRTRSSMRRVCSCQVKIPTALEFQTCQYSLKERKCANTHYWLL